MNKPSLFPWRTHGIEPSQTTLLVIDDTIANLKVLSQILGNQGFRVLMASRPEAGLQRALRGQPDLILLDIIMPEMDGFEAFRRLHADEHTRDIPVIFMTALSDAEDKVRGLNLGAVDYITKPIQHEELLARLALHLRLRMLNRRLESLVEERTRALVESNRSLTEARKHAEAANEAKGRFLANMSHELRTPLNTLVGMTELLIGTPLDEEQRLYLDTIQTSSTMMLGLVNDILDLSKLDSDAVQLEHVSFDLHQCIENSLDLVANDAARKGIELTSLIEPAVPPAIMGDPSRLHQILVNLLANAVKFTSEGTVSVSAEARPLPASAAAPRCALTFTVSDTGIGISDEALASVFDAFTQADDSTTRKYGGTGLGLAICQHLVRRMGSVIHVHSEVGQGSRFSFSIEVDVDPAVETPALGPPLQGSQLLVIDPHATSRGNLEQLARSWGMKVTIAADDSELADREHELRSVDVALVAVKDQPDEDPELAQRVAERLPPGTPLIAMTTVRNGMDQGARQSFSATLPKPIKIRPLRRTILRMLAPQAEVVIAEQDVPKRSLLQSHHDLGQRAPLRILVAEDNLLNQRLVKSLFRRLGYHIDLVSNGIEVLESLERSSYDLILMDVQMPQMDGLETTQQIRRRLPSQSQPYIVALTADTTPSTYARCKNAGMDHYLNKPFASSELIDLLKTRWASQYT